MRIVGALRATAALSPGVARVIKSLSHESRRSLISIGKPLPTEAIMADKTGIEWTDATWNPVTGCAKVSQGCKNCYALRDWPRMSANPKTVYYGRAFTDVQCHPERLGQPIRWKRPRRVFVNSMSRSEEHTSELQSIMRSSYAVFFLK